MSKKGIGTTSDFLEWSKVIYLIESLKKDKDYTMLLLVGLGSYTGLRYSDLKKLKWNDILSGKELVLTEKKTNKTKEVGVNPNLKEIISYVIEQDPGRLKRSEFILTNKKGGTLSIQYLNKQLKSINIKYKLKLNNCSVHSFRKSFGRRIYEMNNSSEHSLIVLSQIFNHSSLSITRSYLNLKKEEINNIYLSL